MTIRTYRAKNVADALAQVKKELGSSAVILHTRTYKAGGILGVGARQITEITATDQPPRRMKEKPAPAPSKPVAPVPRSVPPTGRPVAASESSARSFDRSESDPPRGPSNEPSMKDVARMIVAATARTPIEEELASIKKMVTQVLRTSAGPANLSMPEPLFDCYQRLLESAVATEIASDVAGKVRDELAAPALQDAEQVRRAVLKHLAAFIPVCGESGKIGRAPDGRPLTIALVGPTGVGKTTTIAKLAATYRLKQGQRVGLITCDTYRIAAVEQLRTYAGIINIPLKVAMTPAEMRAACAALAECDVVLIDTAGRAPRDAARLGELRALLDAAAPHQVHLVLTSAAAESFLLDAAQCFAPLGCDRLIITKLDETVTFGVVVNVLKRLSARLSFVTTGQEVPDHIEAISADRLARLVLGPEAFTR